MTHPDGTGTTSFGSVPDGHGPEAPEAEDALLAAGVPCAVLDMASKRFVDANPAFAALLRLDASQVKGLDFFSLVPPQNRPLIEAVLSGMAAGTVRSIDGQVRWQLPCGESLHVERWLRVDDDGSHPTKVLLTALPAGGPAISVQPTDQNTPDPPRLAIGTMDHAGRLSEISVDAAAWLGLNPEECRGMGLHAIVHPDDAPLLSLAAGRSGVDRQGVATGMRVRRHDGEWIPVRCEVSPLCGHNPPRFAFAMRVTESTPSEESADQRAARLEDHLWRIALEVAAAGVGNPTRTTETWWAEPALRDLSQRQLDILRRLVRGERVRTIAQDLYLSQSTVRNYLSAIYHRLGVHSQSELLARLLPSRDGSVGQRA